MIRLLAPHPALLVENGEKVLLAGDLHLGLEYELAKQGINIPYQWSRMLDELVALLVEYKPDRLLLLGDVKHGVPSTSFKEKREIPSFFDSLHEHVEYIDVTRGNHDANIQKLLPDYVALHSSRGVMFGDGFRVAALHGHAWPPADIMSADCVVMAHNHPTVMLSTPIGIRITRRAWIRGKPERLDLIRMFLEQDGADPGEDPEAAFRECFHVEAGAPEFIVMPMFNDLLGGLPVNSEAPESLLGPLFRSGAVDFEDFDATLLDGSYMGKIGFLRDRLEYPQFS